MSAGRERDDGDGSVTCCPECGSISVRFKAGQGTDDEQHWLCYDCGEQFAELAEREPRLPSSVGTPGRDRLCDRLARADPEDVTGGDE